MATKIQLRRGTTSEWSTNNPVLSDGEVGWDRTLNKMKFGDGSTPWNDLPFLTDATGGVGGGVIVSDTAPTDAPVGTLFYDTDAGV